MLDVPTCSNASGKSYGFHHAKVKLSYVKRSSAIESRGKNCWRWVASKGRGEALSLKIKNPCRCGFGDVVG